MVKTLSTALVVFILLVAQSYSQEVFSGEQKAKPKYPKAQPTAPDHVKSDVHVEKAIPLQTDKTASATKQNTTLKPAATAAVKATPASAKTADVTSKTASATQNVHKEPVPLSQPGKATNVQRSTLNARPPTTESAKTSPKVEIAVAKEAAAVSAPAEGPNQKSKATAKTGVAKTSTVESTAVHVNTAQVSAAKAATSENKTAAKSSPKVEIAVAKPTAAKGDQKIEAKVSSPVAVTSGNTKVAGTKNSVTENNGTHTSPGLADATRKDQKAEIRGQSNAAAATAVASHKETTVTASAKPMRIQNSVVETTIAQPINNHFDTAFTKLADGFDFPVGKPDAQGYYKARGFRSRGHLGEDWDGVRGGDTDLGDPIYCVGDGLVVFARDCHMGWGNVLIVRHSYREGGTVKTVDSLYGHLQSMLVHRGQAVARGQKIATMGNAHGLYDAHLHLEIRKNLEIGMSRAAFAQDFSNYYDPTQFIQEHRHLQTGGGSYRVAMNTFTRDARIKWDKARNYSHAHTGGGSSQSAAALKKAVAAQH